MKTMFLKAFILMLSLSLLSATCSSDDDGNLNNNSVEIAQIESDVQLGTWRITSYVDSGQNETNDFSGFNFTFGSDGTLTATNGQITKTGTWSVTDDSSSDDNDENDIDFNIFFPVPDTDDFEDLNDDWDLISHTSTRIVLKDVSGGDGSIDDLVFEKN